MTALRHYGWVVWLLFLAHLIPVAVAVPEATAITGSQVATQLLAERAATPSRLTDPLSAGALLQVTLMLGVTLALIFSVAWLFRRLGTVGLVGRYPVKVLGGGAVGSRERVVLVQVGETQLLLGVAPGRVSHLHTFETTVMPQTAVTSTTTVSPFAQRLAQLLQRPHSS
ncbi:MAG: flagellar biosynthetic protein FliO [Gammaproteobacteria bacterium]|nr:flagellar biosynthetic protein FliO [Gammaproteobacteria bacterium]